MFDNSRIQIAEHEIRIKGNSHSSFLGIFALLMSLAGVKMFLGGEDMIGRVCIGAWIGVLWIIGAAALLSGSKKLLLNEEGVRSISWIREEFMTWSEIEDYGLSYYGKTNKHLNTYSLYFSKQKQKTKNECRKILRGRMIKCDIVGKEYGKAVSKVIPFCREKTRVIPFVAVDKNHFLY